MSPRLLAALLAVAALFALVATACGGDGESTITLAEYFRRFDSLDDDIASQQASLRERYPDPYQGGETARRFYEEGVPLLDNAVERLSAIDPPSAVEEVHNRVLNAMRVRAEASQTILEDLEDAQSRDDVLAAVNAVSDDVDAALANLDQACLDLQAIADQNGVAVNLECETGEDGETPVPITPVPVTPSVPVTPTQGP